MPLPQEESSESVLMFQITKAQQQFKDSTDPDEAGRYIYTMFI